MDAHDEMIAANRGDQPTYEELEVLLSASQAREAALREKLSRLEYMLGTVSDVLYGGESAWADIELNEFGIHIRRAITDKLRYKEQAEAAIEAAQREANCQTALAGLYQQEVSKRAEAQNRCGMYVTEIAELRKLLESKAPEWTCAMDELPAIGQRVILCISGVVQHEIYIMDAADKSDFYTEYFWSRPELEEGLEISPNQFWMPLPQPKEPKQ